MHRAPAQLTHTHSTKGVKHEPQALMRDKIHPTSFENTTMCIIPRVRAKRRVLGKLQPLGVKKTPLREETVSLFLLLFQKKHRKATKLPAARFGGSEDPAMGNGHLHKSAVRLSG